MTDALFTYGTLMPGRLRWPLLELHAERWVEATACGVLYDTGNGWPAARFGSAASTVGAGERTRSVPGWVVAFADGVLERLLPGLDAMEGIGGPGPDPYVRRVITTSAGEAWAYDATSVPDTWEVIERWAGRPEA